MEINLKLNRKQIGNYNQETLAEYILGLQEQSRIALDKIDYLHHQIKEAFQVIGELKDLEALVKDENKKTFNQSTITEAC